MTTTSTPQPVPDATTSGSPAIAGGVFERLNPADGLFLRADHLKLMQQYASDLAAAVGAGLGPGVVFGFTCRLNSDAVEATGGLAFAAGQPLRSTVTTSVSLKDLQLQGDDFWVVEIVPATWDYGSEPVYGGLCEDPCGLGSGIRPYAAEGVELKLRHDSLKGFGGKASSLQRNWLASQYFEREREYGGASARSSNAPWLLPDAPSGTIADITRQSWSEGTGAYEEAAVPLGVVWKRGDKWQLDVWTARRDRGEPTPAAAWQWRLGWRPRSVFLAQILQFQDQLAQADRFMAREMPAYVRQALEYLGAGQELIGTIRSKYAGPAVDHLVKAYETLSGQEPSSLCDVGFEELPPAGYLPWDFQGEQDPQYFFGGEVDVRVRECRADFVAHAIEQVQHMDRIPLKGHVNCRPKVDLLIPCEPNDLAVTSPSTSGYGWSAFIRRREDLHERRDSVDVWVAALAGSDDVSKSVHAIADGSHPEGLEKKWTVNYPPDEWAVPMLENGVTWDDVKDALSAITDPQGSPLSLLAVVGVTQTFERLSLAAVRAALFVTPEQVGPNAPVWPVPTYAVTPAVTPLGSKWTEATVLLFGPGDLQIRQPAQGTGSAPTQQSAPAPPQGTNPAAPQQAPSEEAADVKSPEPRGSK